MESSPGSQGAGHSRGLKDPFCSRRSLNLQGAILFVIFSTYCRWVGANRNTSITYFDTIRPWDKALKTERHCQDFHAKNTSKKFFYWPEDDPDAHFEHCCTTRHRKKLENYTHGASGPRLLLGAYYDLGLIDKCLPYWRCHNLYQTYSRTNIYTTYCVVNDLAKLYKRRFMVGAVLKHGLLESAIPFIVSLEILVVLFVGLYWCIWRRPGDGLKVLKAASKAWLRYSRRAIVRDWTHLCLLAVVGNGLVEAIGRQNAYASQSKSFYNYAQLYVWLTFLVWFSSFLLQVTHWIAKIDIESAAHSHQDLQNFNSAEQGQILSRQPSAMPELEAMFRLDDDWKWQPMAAQIGILFCLWNFLANPIKENDATTGSVFGLIVSAGCLWSGLFASKIIVRAFPWLLRRLYRNLRKPQQSLTPQQS